METSKIRNFLKLPWDDRYMFFEALMLQILVGLLLKFIPFRQVPHLFDSRKSEDGNKLPGSGLNRDIIIDSIKLAIQRSSCYSPWKNKCLISSLAARVMLRRRRISSDLYLGVKKDSNGKLLAHAWLMAEGHEIVKRGENYTGIYNF